MVCHGKKKKKKTIYIYIFWLCHNFSIEYPWILKDFMRKGTTEETINEDTGFYEENKK